MGLCSIRIIGTVIRMENDTATGNPVGSAARAAIADSVGSVHAASQQAGIPYATLDRRLKDGEQFKVAELRRLGAITGRDASDFLGSLA